MYQSIPKLQSNLKLCLYFCVFFAKMSLYKLLIKLIFCYSFLIFSYQLIPFYIMQSYAIPLLVKKKKKNLREHISIHALLIELCGAPTPLCLLSPAAAPCSLSSVVIRLACSVSRAHKYAKRAASFYHSEVKKNLFPWW